MRPPVWQYIEITKDLYVLPLMCRSTNTIPNFELRRREARAKDLSMLARKQAMEQAKKQTPKYPIDSDDQLPLAPINRPYIGLLTRPPSYCFSPRGIYLNPLTLQVRDAIPNIKKPTAEPKSEKFYYNEHFMWVMATVRKQSALSSCALKLINDLPDI